jgi:hypothetical protein
MLMICELLNQMVGLQLHEIQQYCELMGRQIPTGLLKQYLYLLQRVRLVDSVRRGHNQYFIPLVIDRYLRFVVRDGAPPVDRARLLMDVASFYRAEDPARSSALAPVLARMT